MEAAGGFEPPNGGFADPCLTTWLRRPEGNAKALPRGRARVDHENGAGNGIRTRDLNLGKVALYQLSYSRRKSRLIPEEKSIRGMDTGQAKPNNYVRPG